MQAVRELPDLVPEAASSSVLTTTHNSPRPQLPDPENPDPKYCPYSRWVKGSCDAHGQYRWINAPCKRRTCSMCGPKGRYRIAQRIAHGIRQLPCRSCGHGLADCWGHGRSMGHLGCGCKGMVISAAWLVLTFAEEEAEAVEWKPKAVKRVGKFIAWLRKTQPDIQYVATYELTARGRLHVNLIVGPWRAVLQSELQDRWGARLSVEWVRDDEKIARETAKSYSPESLGKYMAKLKQSVPEEWGRRVSYSNKWPKLPKGKRLGVIRWAHEWQMEPVEFRTFEFENDRGWWREVSVGEWACYYQPVCDCFDYVEDT